MGSSIQSPAKHPPKQEDQLAGGGLGDLARPGEPAILLGVVFVKLNRFCLPARFFDVITDFGESPAGDTIEDIDHCVSICAILVVFQLKAHDR